MPITPIQSRIRRIQQALGLHADGILGPETLTALEQRLGIVPPAASFSLEVSESSLSLLVQFEVSSRAHYERKLTRPTWPGEASGVTIGIGYDLGMTPKSQIASDWQGELSDMDVARLSTAHGITGPAAATLARSLRDIQIPFATAERVFYRCTLPRFAKLTRSTFPGAQSLPADAQGMLLSLIYNRGPSVAGSRRREMLEIRKLVAAARPDLDAIAGQFEAMTRLWPDSPGLQQRRRREAAVLRAADRAYDVSEIVRL